MDVRSERDAWRLWYAWYPVRPQDDGVHWLEVIWRRRLSRWPIPYEFRTFRRSVDKAREAARREI
ncbi:hypothetical protein F2982_28100 (plasmid) [Rhizobium sp. BG4]|nr:hypothetical protein F2982_28100 [Rhizobium sp. BG4]